MTVPAFTFRGANTTRGLIASGEGSAEFLHPLLPTQHVAANGFLMVLNGWNLNRRLADVTGYTGAVATAVELLQMRAPRQPVMPAVSMIGNGRIFGRSYFWQFRWEDSRTGEVSGLSPLPTALTDLGALQPAGSSTYLGQNAAFEFLTADAPAHADTLRLFRNVSQEGGVVFSVKAVSILGQTSVSILDDFPDDEIATNERVSADVPSGPTWPQGILYPVCRAWQDPTNRMVYFGIRRMGLYWRTSPTVQVTQGSDLITINSIANTRRLVEPGRIGQRVKFYLTADLADPVDDPTVYRFLKAESAFTFRVTPEIAVSGDIASGATITAFFAIEDDRDERVSWISESGKPWLIDPAKGIAVGDDYDDGPRGWFSLGGTVFQITRRRIYAALDYVSLDPSKTVRFVQMAAEGMVGFDAGCVTPMGYVFVHEKLGVRLFDGNSTMPLDRGADAFADFMARTQFDAFEPSMLETVVCLYDHENHAVIVSYVPLGGSCMRETLVFSIADRVWRGPYRERIVSGGPIRTTTNEDQLVTGDDFGNLMVREAQVLDVLQTNSIASDMVGTVGVVSSPRVVVDLSQTFDLDDDERVRGCPIWFRKFDGTMYFARIADLLSDMQIELDAPPVDEDGVAAVLTSGWTYGIGSIRWDLVTAQVNLGEPIMKRQLKLIGTRFERGSASETFEVGVAKDGSTSFTGERVSTSTASPPTVDVSGIVSKEFSFEMDGFDHSIRMRGTARIGLPKITGVVAKFDIGEGTGT